MGDRLTTNDDSKFKCVLESVPTKFWDQSSPCRWLDVVVKLVIKSNNEAVSILGWERERERDRVVVYECMVGGVRELRTKVNRFLDRHLRTILIYNIVNKFTPNKGMQCGRERERDKGTILHSHRLTLSASFQQLIYAAETSSNNHY
jgi:hypothetical protein